MSAVLITGSSGYIGYQLMSKICKDNLSDHVLGIDLVPPAQPMKGAHFIQADIRHPLLLEIMQSHSVETVIHCAFASETSFSTHDAHEVNIAGTMKLLNACTLADVKHVIVASCYSVYGANFDNPLYMTEGQKLSSNRRFFDTVEKVEIENLVDQYARNHREKFIKVFRAAPVIGPGANSFHTDILAQTLVPVVLGFDPLVQFLHIHDCIQAVITLMTLRDSTVINFAADGAVPLRKLIRSAGGFAAPVIQPLLFSVSELLWHSGMKLPSREHLEYLKYSCTLSNRKMKAGLHVTPRYSTEDTVREYIEYLRVKGVIEHE